jgi:hypothetical protein
MDVSSRKSSPGMLLSHFWHTWLLPHQQAHFSLCLESSSTPYLPLNQVWNRWISFFGQQETPPVFAKSSGTAHYYYYPYTAMP